MTVKSYTSPANFKVALDSRLRSVAGIRGIPASRLRQLLVFERFLARVVEALGPQVTLKGGLALEFRVERARTTKDVDLRLVGSSHDLLARFQAIGRRELPDFMTFEVGLNADHPEIDNEGLRYEGFRFRVECQLDGKRYGQAFGLDVAFGDPMSTPPDEFTGDDLLDFIGVPPPKILAYPVETHVAEKLHAYTLPRDRENSRMKDLPDLALLAAAGPLDAQRLRAALMQTFGYRATHPVPARLPSPPLSWAPRYTKTAREDGLPWANLADVTEAARRFLDPLLSEAIEATWDPATWHWVSPPVA